MMTSDLTRRTIEDFGDQWTEFTTNDGYYGSVELFADIVGPLLPLDSLKGKRVAEIGSGTGRIVHMLLAAGAGKKRIDADCSSGKVPCRDAAVDASAWALRRQ